jgi:hypothetical protein
MERWRIEEWLCRRPRGILVRSRHIYTIGGEAHVLILFYYMQMN